MWSTLHDAKVRCKNRWSEAHTNTIQGFYGGRSSILSKRELCENAKKFFCLLWKHFRRKGIKEVFKKKKRRRRTQAKIDFNIFNHEKEFLLEMQSFDVEEGIADGVILNRGSSVELIKDLEKNFLKRNFQDNFSLVEVFEQIRDLLFSGIAEGIGIIKSADICSRKGEIPFLSLAPNIFRTHYQKVAVFFVFYINCFKL
jgi:hypothetical protein